MLLANGRSISYAFEYGPERMTKFGDSGQGREGGARLADRGQFRGHRLVAAWIVREVSVLDPGCFALVMATGIVSNAFFLQGQRVVSEALFAVNVAAYVWLGLLTALRVAFFWAALRADLVNSRLVFSFFTFVAATDVLGMSIGMRGFSMLALSMWLWALATWAILIYLGFVVLAFFNTPDGAKVVDGAWLNAIVATQSLVILGVEVALPAGNFGSLGFMMAHMLWTIGLGLYGIYVALLSYRIFFFDLKPAHATPLLWVVMGAAAISADAVSTLIAEGGTMPFLRSMQPFVDGVTLGMWAWATWWIPLLILLGVWKHGIHRAPVGYTPLLWCIVFPVGMYAVASLRLAQVADVPALSFWSWTIAWVALAVWGATAIALIDASFRSMQNFVRTATMPGTLFSREPKVSIGVRTGGD
jgi:tellurite resistance protein TehA-like permease